MRARHIRCRPFVAKTAAVGAIISLIGGFSFLGNADFAASVERLVRSIGAVEYTFQAFDNEAGARALAQCFNASTTGDSLFNNFSSGGTLAAVVPLSGLLDLSSSEYDGNVSQAVTASLHALIRGGVQHIILVPGNAPSWSVDLLSECHAAVQHGAVDGRGFPTSVAFSALSPATVSCIGTPPAGLAAGVAWAVSAGASAVLALEHVTALSRRALFFDAALPRLLPQVAGLHEPTGRPEDISEVAGAALPVFSPLPQEWLSVPKQIQQHFTACGGLTPVCSPITSRSLRLCSRWLRPAVQYGLCHNRSLYSRGRHTTVAANSPFDDVLFSGPRLLEEVTTLTLTQGATVALRSDSRFIFNRLAHRDAAWVLVDTEVLGGAAAQLAVESALSLVLGGNLTVLPPGRLCNVTVTQKPSRGAEEVGSPGSEFLSEADAQDWDTTSRAAVAAAFQAVGSNCADRQLNRTDTVSGEGLVAAVHALALALVQRSALRTEGADGLLRWMRIFVAALRLDEQRRQYARDAAVRSRAPSPSSSPSVLPRISLSSKRVVPSVLPNVTRPTPSHPASAFEQVAHAKLCVSIPSLPSLQPTARAVYKHCFAGHHNVRDIVYVINFNTFEASWGPHNLDVLHSLMRPFFPVIIGMHAGHPSDRNSRGYNGSGIDELNLERCDAREGGSWLAQRCAADAMTRYGGHLGYVISNDDVHVSAWNTLGYAPSRFWRKWKDPGKDYHYGTTAGDCYAWKPRELGAATLGRMHARLPAWVLPVKLANFNRTDGVSCQTMDAYYAPGELAPFSAWFLLETFREGTFVELATSTLFDTAAPRAEHVVMRAIHMGGNNGGISGIRQVYGLRWHDYTHALKLSRPEALNVSRGFVAAALAQDLFYRPNVTRLALRPPFANMWRR